MFRHVMCGCSTALSIAQNARPTTRRAIPKGSDSCQRTAVRATFPAFTTALGTRTFRSAALRDHTRLHLSRGSQIVRMSHVSTTGKPMYDLYVKGSPEKGELGDCPFSHRTMLTLEEKGIPYNKLLIDELNMPEWIQEVSPEKQIPFGTELESGKWLYDSDKMIPYLEDKYSDRKKLGKPDDVDKVGTNLMPSLIEFLTSKGSEEEEKRTALLGVLREINNALQKSDGPYFGGKDVNAADLRVAPQLKHVMIGTKAVKGFQFPGELHGIYSLLEAMEGRQSWKNTYYTEKYVSDGWHKKMEVMGAK